MRYPAAIALIFMVAGILGAVYLPLPEWLTLLITFTALIAAAVLVYLREMRCAAVAAAVLLLGIGYSRTQLFTTQHAANHISKFTTLNYKVRFTGRISFDPDIRDRHTYLIISADSLHFYRRSIPVTGKVLVRIRPATARFQYDDYVSVYGYLNRPPRPGNPGLFDYRIYLRNKGIHSYCSVKGGYNVQIIERAGHAGFISGIVLPARNYLLDVYSELPTPGNGELMAGFLLGEKRGIPDKIREAFIASGTMHLLAVSGSNLALVSFLYFLIVGIVPMSRRWKLIGSLPFIVIFCFMTNNEPSVVRAAVMLGLGVIAYLMRRKIEPVNLAGAAGLLILGINPLWLYDVGFQLSFAAVAGIVLYVKSGIYNPPPARNIAHRVWHALIYSVFVSLAAFLFTAPIIAYNFNRLAAYSVLANIPAAMAIGAVTTIGAAAAFVHPLGGIINQSVLWAADAAVSLMRTIAEFFSSLPYADLSIPSPDPLMIAIFYLSLIVLTAFRWNPRLGKYGLVLLLILINIKIWSGVIPESNKTIQVQFLDAGYSDALLIYSGTEWNTMIYNGDGRTYEDLGRNTIKPYLLKIGFSGLDNLIITSSDSSSIHGLEDLLQEGFVDNIWLPENDPRTRWESDRSDKLDFKMVKELGKFSAGDLLISSEMVKYGVFKPDKNLKEKAENAKYFPVIIEVSGRRILFAGRACYGPDPSVFNGFDIVQFNHALRDKMPDSVGTKMISTGRPFLYWMEKYADSYGVTDRYRSIAEEGAICYSVDRDGVRNAGD
jgi:competence protein ComEC